MLVFVILVALLVYCFGAYAFVWGPLAVLVLFITLDMIASGEWPK